MFHKQLIHDFHWHAQVCNSIVSPIFIIANGPTDKQACLSVGPFCSDTPFWHNYVCMLVTNLDLIIIENRLHACMLSIKMERSAIIYYTTVKKTNFKGQIPP